MTQSPKRGTKPQETAPANLFPIRTVSSLTGVNAITLRAWERRHGLIKPARTRSGHRLYKQSDIDAINRIVSCLNRGVSIGQVGSVLREPEPGKSNSTDRWAAMRNEMMLAVMQFDEARLEHTYNGALSEYPTQMVTQNLLMPLLRELGLRWDSDTSSIAEEHFFSVYLRNKLGARFHHRNPSGAGPKLIVACLPGEFHEVGLLLFAMTAHERGYRLVLLGANLPLPALTHAARQSRADGIVLSGSYAGDPDIFTRQLPELVTNVGIPVIVGGETSVLHRDSIVSAGALPIGSDIEVALQKLQVYLNIQPGGGQ